VIKEIRKATAEEWDSMVDSAGPAVYFQTREWFDIWADYAGFESVTKLICFGSRKKVLLPLSRMKLLGGLVQCHFLAPKVFGGFVTTDKLDENEKEELFEFLERMKMLYCAVNPYDTLTNEFDKFTDKDFTQVLELSSGFESIFKNWSKGHASAAKKGIREGITTEVASTENDWRSYYGLYQDNLGRWGKKATNHYTWKLFEIMYKKKSPHIKLWLAKFQKQLISGAICFYQNKHVAYWHSATLKEFFKLNGPHVLQYHIIKDACGKGFLYYDFLPSSRLEGVIHFKNGFSPQKKPVNIYMSSSMAVLASLRTILRTNAIYKLLMKDSGF